MGKRAAVYGKKRVQNVADFALLTSTPVKGMYNAVANLALPLHVVRVLDSKDYF